MGDIEAEYTDGDLGTKVNGVVTASLAIEKRRCRSKLQRLRLVVHLTIDDRQQANLVVVLVQLVLLGDVGQLLAGRVNLVEIRVCNQMTAFGGVSDVDVAFQCRDNRLRQVAGDFRTAQKRRRCVGPVRVAIVGGNGVIAILETKRLRVLVRIRVHSRMELAKEMLRLEALRIGGREVCQKARLRRRQVEDNSGLIRRVDRHGLTTNGDVVLRLFEDVRVQHQVVVIELHVRAGERRAVRPFVALAQMEGQLGEIAVPLPALRNVRNDRLKIIGETDQVHVTHRQEVGGAGLGSIRQDVKRAAIFADRVIRNHDKRLGRHPVGKCRQVRVALDLGVQRRDVRVGRERHFTICGRLEFRQLKLLRIGTHADTLHVCDSDCRATGICGGRKNHQRQRR